VIDLIYTLRLQSWVKILDTDILLDVFEILGSIIKMGSMVGV
jgi:hypothetical protein